MSCLQSRPFFLSTAMLAAVAAAAPQSPDASQPGMHTALSAVAQGFVANRGQWHQDLLFAARFGAMQVFVERAAFTVDVQQVDRTAGDPSLGVPSEVTASRGAAVRFSFGSPSTVTPRQLLPGRLTFLLGNDRSRWCGDVPAYASVRHEAIAPGVALEAYGKEGHFEYDLLAAAGADLRQVTIDVAGADGLSVRADGSLAIATAYGTILQSAPVAFAGDGRRVECRVELRGGHAFGFVAPGWNGDEPLRIDPGLTYGSYFGGSAADGLSAVAVGPDGVLTLAGGAGSVTFPVTPGGYQTFPNGSDCIVIRLDPRLPPAAQMLSATWFGGNGTDTFAAIALDAQGTATLFGQTRSTDLPVSANAFQANFGGGTQDSMVAQLDLQQTGAQQLVYATYLGGSANETVQGPCSSLVVANGVLTVTASTQSLDFPTSANAWSRTRAGSSDGFVAQLDPSLPPAMQLVYSTYFGGSGGDGGVAVHIDPNGRIAIGGTTSSSDFPVTANAFDSTLGGPGDGMLMLLDPRLPPAQQIVYATYFGGSQGEGAGVMDLDRTGAFCFGGTCSSPDLPVTANAFSQVFSSQDAYLARLDPSLPPAQQLTYCTYLGGTAAESATAIVVDAAGVITMSGGTTSTDFPVTDGAFQTSNAGGFQDTWIVRLDPTRPPARQLLYSTYLGGDGLETLFGLADDAMGGVWAVGFTQSTDFPTTPNGFGTAPNGGNDAFLAHLDMLPTGVTAYGASSPGCNGAVAASVTSMPRVGNADFAITCTNMTPPAVGLLGVSLLAATSPVHLLGVDLWIDLASTQTMFLSTTQYGADVALPIPANPALAGLSIAAQFAWYEGAVGPTCPTLGWSASQGLHLLVQP